jgi:branched-chain amino acid transport system substrate-binding protein
MRVLALLFLCLLPIPSFAEEPIKIGVLIPLTGPLAPYGEAARRGFELALEDFPNLGEKLSLVYEDSRYDNATSLSALEKLSSKDKILGVYAWGTGPIQAIAPVAESRGIATFAISANHDAVKDKRFLIQFNYDMRDCARAILDYLRANAMTRMSVLLADIEYFQNMLLRLNEQKAKEEEIEILATLSPAESDFRNFIGKLRNKKPDAVGVLLVSGQLQQFYRQLNDLRLNVKTISTDFLDDPQEIQLSGPTIEGTVFPAPFVTEEFITRYRARYKTISQVPWAANAYDFIRVLNLTLASGKTPQTGEELLESFRAVAPGSGASGPLKVIPNARGHAVKVGVVLKRVTNGEAIQVQGTFVQ